MPATRTRNDEIRHMHETLGWSRSQLAAEYRLSPITVGNILRGRDLNPPPSAMNRRQRRAQRPAAGRALGLERAVPRALRGGGGMSALYFAYGSNLDPVGMANRCPAAVVVGRARLPGWRLTFRGVADVEPAPRGRVEGVLWSCTAECIRALDRYEGVRGGFYRKEWLEVQVEDGPRRALVYVMNATAYENASLPSGHYLDSIARGYVRFGLPPSSIRAALRRTERRARGKGVTQWRDDGRKRLVPLDGPAARPRRTKAEKRPEKRLREVSPWDDPDAFSDEDLLGMGFSPATVREVRLEQHGFVRGERIA